MLKVGLLAFGANLPFDGRSPAETVTCAMNLISDNNVLEIARSRLYATPAFPDPSGPRYVNACMSVQTRLPAKALLKHLHALEAQLGRVREQRWGARVIDIDLLSLGLDLLPDRATYDTWASLAPNDQVARTPDQLILPHPRIADRGFVLVPLAEIAPRWKHPVCGMTAQEMLEKRPEAEISAIEPLETVNSACQA